MSESDAAAPPASFMIALGSLRNRCCACVALGRATVAQLHSAAFAIFVHLILHRSTYCLIPIQAASYSSETHKRRIGRASAPPSHFCDHPAPSHPVVEACCSFPPLSTPQPATPPLLFFIPLQTSPSLPFFLISCLTPPTLRPPPLLLISRLLGNWAPLIQRSTMTSSHNCHANTHAGKTTHKHTYLRVQAHTHTHTHAVIGDVE